MKNVNKAASFQVELSWHDNTGESPWALEPSRYQDSLMTTEKLRKEKISGQ